MEKILDRIRKLLALASNNSSEHEREAALSKAHSLLLEHNLRVQDVVDNPEVMDAFNNQSPYNASPWILMIMGSVASLYFCKFVYRRGLNKTFTAIYIGMRVDAEVARMVADSVVASVKRQADYHGRATGGSVASFKNAAAAAIYWRCDKLKEEAQNDKVPGTALVVQSLYKTRAAEAEAWSSNHFGELGKPRSKVRLRADASGVAGSEYAKGVPLTAHVKGG